MSERIELSPEERVLAAVAAQDATDIGMRHFGVVDRVIAAINEVRERAE
jgi:hypothetical protein